jgi:hypothetical protein
MIAGLGIPGADAIHWHQARAESALPDASREELQGSGTMAQRSAGPDMPTLRPPVPFLRQPRPASSTPLQPEAPEAAAEGKSQDALDMEAAKAAIERDGYRRVMMLDKTNNGAWRAKGYRGVSEVFLKVDSHGAVSAE